MLSADSITSIEIRSDKSKGDRNNWDPYFRTIAKLGLDGWEMVGIENDPDSPAAHFLFKRPLQQ
jgi:hypothetical protein